MSTVNLSLPASSFFRSSTGIGVSRKVSSRLDIQVECPTDTEPKG